MRGARVVATALFGRGSAAKSAFIEGTPGAVWLLGRRPKAAFAFHLIGDRIAEIEIVTDPAVVAALDIEFLGSSADTN